MEKRDGDEVVVVPGQWRGEEGCFEDGFRSGAQDQHPGHSGQARGAMQEPDLRRRCQPMRGCRQTPIWSRGICDGEACSGRQLLDSAKSFSSRSSKRFLDIISSRARNINIIRTEGEKSSPLPIFCRHLRPLQEKMRQCIRSPGSAAIGAGAQMNIIAFPGKPNPALETWTLLRRAIA